MIRHFLALAFCAMMSLGTYAEDTIVEQLVSTFDQTEETQRPSAIKAANELMKELLALEFLEEPQVFTQSTPADTVRQQVWYWAAEYFYDQQQYQKSVDYAKKALPLCRVGNDRTIEADCLSLISINYVRLCNYEAAAEYAQQVYQLDKKSGDKDRESSSLNTLAGIYLYANQPKEAEKYVLRGIELAEQAGNNARLAVLKGKASEIYHALGDDHEALRYADAAYQIDKEAGREDKATLRQAQKASVLIGLHLYKEAEAVLTDIIPKFRQTGDRQSLGVACNKMGMALLSQHRDDEAVAYYREAAGIFATIGDMANELHAHRGLYESLWKSDPDEAKRELDQFNDLKDSLYNNVSAESLAKYNAEFGNDWLKLENHEQQTHLRIALALMVILALVAVVVWLVMRHRHRKQTLINERLNYDINELRKKFQELNIQYDNAMITKSNDKDREELKKVDQDFLERAVTTINRLINDGKVDANSVAKSMGMSLFQFRQRLTTITGVTPQAYIQVLRMRRARYLLDHHHELNISEVAKLCAYEDAPSFTRSFKNAFGITPSQYLKRQD